ncbi:hypothetical protein GGR32_000133 [Mesonia hippocampi]|uniref:DUF6046 domain-containing protein n=1 Tax=Mesonia hippocampi TaxID=1628250 RepID=A0A840EL88_9FLAO|nr:DUF6046 domain-containing protein [Mesonia hippocampi]MBB4117861.1 hypothetical protein [Mesonia hippocampi]
MANEFNIKNLILQSHGYVSEAYPDLRNRTPIPESNIGKAVFAKDSLGRPMFMDFSIAGKKLPNEPLVTINTRKIIQETVLVSSEKRGTVKEFISSGDYQIKIEGVCIIPGQKNYPEEQVKAVIDLCERNEALEVDNDITDLFGIYKLVIKDYGFGNMQGKPYSQSFYINAVSDDDFYATVSSNKITRL